MKQTPPIVAIVAALMPEMGIGFKGKLPWRLKKEMKYFKDVTTSTSSPSKINALIMGRKTWESIPIKFRPLPNRLNIVLSRSYENKIEDSVIYSNSIDASLTMIQDSDHDVERIYVIGGAQIYNELISDLKLKHLLITEVRNPNKIEMDTFLNFPLYDANSHWEKQSKTRLQEFVGKDIELQDDIIEGDFTYSYTLWNRNN